MRKRRLSREAAMQILFQLEAQGIIEKKQLKPPMLSSSRDFMDYVGIFVNNFYAKDKSNLEIPFIADITLGTLKNLVLIDTTIESCSHKWRLERMDSIDRCILRLASFELLVKKQTAASVVINEALEIAKRYGSENSYVFINGLLDAMVPKKQDPPKEGSFNENPK